jgi:hypothetical protein
MLTSFKVIEHLISTRENSQQKPDCPQATLKESTPVEFFYI